MVNSKELIGTTEYLTLHTRCHINRCRYNRVRLYIVFELIWSLVTSCPYREFYALLNYILSILCLPTELFEVKPEITTIYCILMWFKQTGAVKSHRLL
jgi:hypothetical protein